MQIIELSSDEEFARIYPFIKQLNPTITKTRFKQRLKAMRAQGYRCIAAVEKDEYLGIAGFWRGTRFWCGDFIDVDNVVVDEKIRSRGIGKKMLNWVEKEAKRLNCRQVGLDCYVTAHAAHRFYMRENYIIKGYHMVKSLHSDEA